MKHRGVEIPLQSIARRPKGWYARDLVALHKKFGGTYPIHGPDATEPEPRRFCPNGTNGSSTARPSIELRTA